MSKYIPDGIWMAYLRFSHKTSMPIGEWTNIRVKKKKKRLSQKNKQRADHAKPCQSLGWYWELEGQNMACVLQRLLYLVYAYGIAGCW